MNLINTINTSIDHLKLNKLRSSLTILGIVIGVAAIIVICALGEGNQSNILKEMERIGADLLWVNIDFPRSTSHSIRGFEEKDRKVILQFCSKIKAASFEENLYSIPFKYLNKKAWFTLKGVNDSYQRIHRLKLLKGRFISTIDERIKAKVCVLEESKHINEVFGMSNPVGKEVLINQQPLRIVGIVAYKSNINRGEEGVAYLPFTTFQKIFRAFPPQLIYVQIRSSLFLKECCEQIERVLMFKYRQKGVKFIIHSLTETLQSTQQLIRLATLVIGSIATISLIVGGIGIMNIMLVSVTERTKEIGIRLAIGARKKDILCQFLIEAVVLSVSGGVIGIVTGVFIAYFAAPSVKVPVIIPLWAVIIGFTFAVVTGILSGFYPAKKAANLDPIEALRYE